MITPGDNVAMARLLPLFPLQLVALPGNVIPLHIFEERYREMVGEAEASDSEFGIVLAKEGGIVNAGCTVRVESVVQRYPDGRFDVLTRGQRRFRLLSVNEDRAYLRGEVEFFGDEDVRPAPPEFRTRALRACQEIHAAVMEGPAPEADLTDPELSFRLAASIQDLDFLDTLLREQSETRRLEMIIATAPRYIERTQYVEKIRRVAPTNGKGHKPQGI